jgi:hypothetical protein
VQAAETAGNAPAVMTSLVFRGYGKAAGVANPQNQTRPRLRGAFSI